jgi:hypothetical protein
MGQMGRLEEKNRSTALISFLACLMFSSQLQLAFLAG